MKTDEAKPKQTKTPKAYNSRGGAAALFVPAAAATYLLALRAEDTGSLQQYFLTFVLLVFAINRLVRVIQG